MMTSEYRATVCPHDCPSACALEVEMLDSGKIGKVRGAKGNSYTRGVICSKVSRYAERVHHPERLTTPLRRIGGRGEGRFAPIGWDEALDEVAARFRDASDGFGTEAVWPYYYAGTMEQLQRDGINRLRHAMGYSGQKNTICTTIAYTGWHAGVGALWGSDPREMAESELIVLWGCNAAATQVNVMTHLSRARKAHGARLVVVDPYRTPTAEKADIHLMVRPGGDGALACAVMQVMLEEGLADRVFLSRHTDFSNAFEAHVRTRTPEWASPLCGLSAEEIRAFARIYGGTAKSFIRLGIGFSRQRNGAVNVHAVSCLPAVSGAWRHRGGGALLASSGLFHLDKTLIEGLDLRRDDVRALDMSEIGPILCGDPGTLAGGPPVKAMLIQNTNPMAVAPQLDLVHRGFKRDDLFVCVHEQFMTETARMADILLPATTFLEHNDLYQTYGQVYLQSGPRLIDPPGECRSNHALVCELAARLGAEHPGFGMTEEEIIDATLSASGYPSLEALTVARWLDCSKPFEQMNFLHGFGWPDGRFRFAPEWGSESNPAPGMPRFPDHWAVNDEDDTHPLRLITPPARSFLNSSFTETEGARAREIAPRLLIGRADARRLGVCDGSAVCVSSARGSVELPAAIRDGIAAGVVVAEGIWPGTHFPGGQGINALTSAEPVAPAGGAAFHDCAVSVVPAR